MTNSLANLDCDTFYDNSLIAPKKTITQLSNFTSAHSPYFWVPGTRRLGQ